MNKRDYMNKLLDLCTDWQKDLFNRMYPEGVNIKKLDWATTQLENTLKGLNKTDQDLKAVKKEAAASKEAMDEKIEIMEKEIIRIERDYQEARREIDRLSNPQTLASSNIQKRLDILDALEAAGVDNWDGWVYAMEILQAG